MGTPPDITIVIDDLVAGEVGNEEDDDEEAQVGVGPHRVDVVVGLQGDN